MTTQDLLVDDPGIGPPDIGHLNIGSPDIGYPDIGHLNTSIINGLLVNGQNIFLMFLTLPWMEGMLTLVHWYWQKPFGIWNADRVGI